MAPIPIRMPDYPRAGGRSFKPLRDRSDTNPRMGEILGIPAQELMDALSVVCSSGCAIMFSPTSDGGALGVHLYVGTDRFRDYAPSAAELSAILAYVRDYAEARMIGRTVPAVKPAVNGSQSA